MLLQAQGKTALLQGILQAYDIFKKAIQLDHQKWIVVLTDGEDNLSNITQERMKKQLSQHHDISLIIIGIGLSEECLEELNELCRMTPNGMFIHSIQSEDLDIAFQSLTNMIYGMKVLEYHEESLG